MIGEFFGGYDRSVVGTSGNLREMISTERASCGLRALTWATRAAPAKRTETIEKRILKGTVISVVKE